MEQAVKRQINWINIGKRCIYSKSKSFHCHEMGMIILFNFSWWKSFRNMVMTVTIERNINNYWNFNQFLFIKLLSISLSGQGSSDQFSLNISIYKQGLETFCLIISLHKKSDPMSQATKRIIRELEQMGDIEDYGISAGPLEDDLYGPEGTIWENGLFQLQILFSEKYPDEPPQIFFKTSNDFTDDKNVSHQFEWNSICDIRTILLSIRSLLSHKPPLLSEQPIDKKLQKTKPKVRMLVDKSLDDQ